MKRFVSLLSVLLVLSTIFIGVTAKQADARWVQEEVGWQISSVGTPYNATAIYVRDTAYTALGGGASSVGDTTSTFSLDNAGVMPRGLGGYGNSGAALGGVYNSVGTNAIASPGPSDTTVVAWLVLQSDTTAAPTVSRSSITVLLDGRAAPLGVATSLARGWVLVDSTAMLTSGANAGVAGVRGVDETVTIPIRSQGIYHSPFSFKQLRARITEAGTGGMPGTRVYIRYWTNDPIDSGARR